MSLCALIGKAVLENGDLLDTTIDQLLGQGLSYDDWKTELENVGGFPWTENVKNVIIKKEFGFFKEEILRLQSEPNTTPALKSKTNSLESILKRLQGLEWVKGLPDEMEKRKRDGRLLGRDAKARCLQYHVSRWKSEVSSTLQKSSSDAKSSKLVEAIPDPKESEALSSSLTQATPATTTTPQSTTVSTANPPNNDTYHDENSFPFRTPSDIRSSTISSIFGLTAQAPASDPTLLGDREIPWVPHTHSYEIGADGTNITLEDFFQFIEQEPNFPTEPLCEVPYFELPRGDGINDSCETYVAQTRKDPNTHGMILEEIIDHYGTQSKKDVWPSNFDQTICEGNTTFSNRDLALFQQDPSQSDCRSVVKSDAFCQSFGTETLALGINPSRENSWEEDHEATFCEPGTQNTPPDSVTTTSKLPPYKIINTQDDSLHHIAVELCKKRQELAAAEVMVSKLSSEVKLLEKAFAKRRSHDPREHNCATTSKLRNPRTSQKRSNDGAPRLSKRQKRKATSLNLEPDYYPPDGESEGSCLPYRHIFALKNMLPTSVSTEEGGSDQSFAKDNNVIASEYAVITALGSSENPEPYFADAVQNPEDCAPRSDTGEKPTLYQYIDTNDLTQSLPTRTPWTDLVSRGGSSSTATNNSGLVTLGNDLLNCRASSVGIMEDVDERIAWVA